MNHAARGNFLQAHAVRAFPCRIANHADEPTDIRHAHRSRPTGGATRIPHSAVKSILVAIAFVFAVALGAGAAAPSAGAAGIPCWKALINDWYDGKIDDVYEKHCYSEAIKHLPRDVDTYSEARGDILRAQLDAIREHKQPTYDESSGAGGTGGAAGGGSDNGDDGDDGGGGGSSGVITRAIEFLGPSNADAIPLPLLVLAGVAFLLLAAAGGSFLSRRVQARRLPPPSS